MTGTWQNLVLGSTGAGHAMLDGESATAIPEPSAGTTGDQHPEAAAPGR
jgi:hypothetical protein